MKKFITPSFNSFWLILIAVVVTLVFTPSASAQWSLVGQGINGEADADIWGIDVSLSADGSVIAAGAMNNDGGGLNSGHVRVFQNICGMWEQIGADIDGEAGGDISGWSISLSYDGSTVAIGAPSNDGNGTNAGHVRVFRNENGTWTQLGSDIDGEAAADRCGYSVSISADGSRVAIGAYLNDGSFPAAGHARVYEYASGAWIQLGSDIDGESSNDTSGESVSISADGSTVAIGAIGNDGTGFLQGHVRVYKYISGIWTQVGADIDGDADLDFFGKSVSLSADGTILAVGSPFNFSSGSSGNGYVKVYKSIDGDWVQQGARIDGEADLDYSGISVSLSADGSSVAIGGYYNAGGGSGRGHVRIFKNIGGSWIQQGMDIDGEEDDEHSGQSVSLSTDGTIVATGAQYHSGGGGARGQVRVFSQSGGGGGGDSDCDGVGDECDMCPGGNDMIDNDEDGMPDCAVLPLYSDIIDEWKCADNKVMIAHEDDGVCYTLCLSYNAAQAHLNHGDYLGPCNSSGCNNSLAVNLAPGSPLQPNDPLVELENADDPFRGFEIHPNPAKEDLEIHFPILDQKGTMTIFNSSGVEVWSQEIEMGTQHIHLESKNIRTTSANGLFFAVLQYGDHTKVKTITILD